MWCTLANKIPTLYRLQKISLEGLGWCTLCKDNEESVNHFFLTCSFTSQVWSHSLSLLNLIFDWSGISLEEAWKTLSSSPPLAHIKSLPLLHIWGILLARIVATFQDKSSSPKVVAK